MFSPDISDWDQLSLMSYGLAAIAINHLADQSEARPYK